MIRLFAHPVSPPLKGEGGGWVGMGIIDKKQFLGRQNRRNKWLFPMDFGCSAEQKTIGIPFRTLPRRKQLEIPFRGTKIEANSWNSVQTLPQKRKQLGIPFRGTKLEANSR
jgi:hypothetical protein